MKRLTALVLAFLMLAQLWPGVGFAADNASEDRHEVVSEQLDTPVYHTVTFMADGELVSAIFVADGTEIGELPAAPERSGKAFIGSHGGTTPSAAAVTTGSRPGEAVYTTLDSELEAKKQSANYRYQDTGSYASVEIFGNHKKNQKPSASRNLAALAGKNGDAWSVANIKNNTDLTATAVVLALPENGALSAYSVKNGKLNALLASNLALGDRVTIPLSMKGDTGLALVVEDGTDDDDAQEIEGALYANEDLYLTGKIPGNGVIEVIPATVSIDGEELVAAYDINIYANANQQRKGKTWQPAGKKVQVHWRDDAFTGEMNVYHMNGETAEFVSTVEADENGWVVFEAESFSVYAFTHSIEKTVTIGGATYRITVTYDSKAGIPDGAEIEASEAPVDEAYLARLTETAAALSVELSSITYSKLLDISIVKDGVEIEPKTPVDVKVELLDAESVTDLRVVHFGDTTEELAAQTQGSTVTFETDGFSLFSLADFSLTDRIYNAIFGDRRLYENDDIILSGRMPMLGSVVAEPAQVEIEGQNVLVAYDIKIYANALMKLLGIAWQPSGNYIHVTVKSSALEDGKTLSVYHMQDAASEPEFIAEVEAQNSSVTFDAKEFSIYPIGEATEDKRIGYEFWYNDGTQNVLLNTQYFRYKDLHPTATLTLNEPSLPGVDGTTWERIFRGWSKTSTNDADANLVNIEALRSELQDLPESAFDESVVKIYANLKNVYYVTYVDINPNNILATEIVPVAESGSTTFTVKPASELRPTIDSETVLEGWYDINNSETVYDPGQANVVLNSSLTLYPKVEGGNWLIFNDNDPVWDVEKQAYVSGGASFTPPVFYLNHETEQPADPTWTGYEFGGWYTDAECTTPFVFGGTLTHDTTVYAKWIPSASQYRVVYWKQRTTDAVDATDEEKTYDYAGSRLVNTNVNTGDVIEINENDTKVYGIGGSSNEVGQQFFIYNSNNTDQSIVVKADGSSVLNVYYDRKVISFNFDANYPYQYYETTDSTGELYGIIDGEYTRVYPDGNGGYETRVTTTRTETVTHNYNGDRYNTTTSNNTNPQQYGVYNNSIVNLYYHTNNGGHWSRKASHSNSINNDQRYTYTRYVKNANGSYGFVNGNMIWLDSSGNYTTTETITQTTVIPYSGKVYKYTNLHTIKGLYGKTLDSGDWPNPGQGKVWYYGGYTFPLALTTYDPLSAYNGNNPNSFTDTIISFSTSNSSSGNTLYVYGQTVDGEWIYTTENLISTAKIGSYSNWYPTETFYGFTIHSYQTGNSINTYGNWTPVTTSGRISYWDENIYLRYSRNIHTLTFYPNNSANEHIEYSLRYGASLADYANQSEGLRPGFYFQGWYADPSCSTPFDFNQTMPDNNIAVYGKWALRRVRVVVEPGANNVYMGSQARTFRVDYDERIDGGLMETAQRAGYILEGWYTDPEFQHPFKFSSPINDLTSDVRWDYQTNPTYAAQRELYGDNTENYENVRGILHLYAKWIPDTSSQGINVVYDPGAASIYDSMGNPLTSVPIDPHMYGFDGTATTREAPSNYSDLYTFKYWEATLADGTTKIFHPSDPITLSELKAEDPILDENGEELRHTVYLRAVYDMTGDPNRQTHITYDGNTFTEDLYIGGSTELKGKTADGTERYTITLDKEVNQTIKLPGTDDFYLDGWELVGWSFTKGNFAAQEAGAAADPLAPNLLPEQEVAADNLIKSDLNDEENTLYARWKPKKYTVKVQQVIESGVPVNSFNYVYKTGVENQLDSVSQQTQTLTNNTSFTVEDLEYYNRVGHVMQIATPTIPDDAIYDVRVNAVVTHDDGTHETLNLTSLGNYPVLGDVVITYTYSLKVPVKLRKLDFTNKTNTGRLTGAAFVLTPVEFNSETNHWENAGTGKTWTMSEWEETKYFQEGTYRITETTAPTDYALIGTELYLTIQETGKFSLFAANGTDINANIAELDSSTGRILTVYDKPIRTVKLKKVVANEAEPATAFSFKVTVLDENKAYARNYNVGAGTTNNVGELTLSLQHNDEVEIKVPYGYNLQVTETPNAMYDTAYTWVTNNTTTTVNSNAFPETEIRYNGDLTYTNTRKVALTLEKQVTGGWGDPNYPFEFTVTINGAAAGTKFAVQLHGGAVHEYAVDSEGKLPVFTLKDDQTYTVYLSQNQQVTIVETSDTESARYRTYWDEGSTTGTTDTKTMQITVAADQTIVVRNDLPPVAPTSYRTHVLPYLLMLLSGAALLLLRGRKGGDADA